MKKQDIRNFLLGNAPEPISDDTDVFLEELARIMLAEGYSEQEFVKTINEASRKAYKNALLPRQY